jgi:hypothetical protein
MIRCGDKTHTIYVSESIPKSDMVERLIAGYKPGEGVK